MDSAEWTGGALRYWRHVRELSQSQLAKAIGVTRVSISQWENGHHAPSAKALWRLGAALRVCPLLLWYEVGAEGRCPGAP